MTNSVGLSNPLQCQHEISHHVSAVCSCEDLKVPSNYCEISSHSIFLHIFLKKASVNCTMARSSITLSDGQGIIDIPHCYLLTSVSSWVYFRLAVQSQVKSKKSTAQISPVRLKIERPRATFNPNASRIISVVQKLILECEIYFVVAEFEELCIGGLLNRAGSEFNSK